MLVVSYFLRLTENYLQEMFLGKSASLVRTKGLVIKMTIYTVTLSYLKSSVLTQGLMYFTCGYRVLHAFQ